MATTDVTLTRAARIGCLDGLRGLAACWVLVGHAMLLTGLHVPLFDQPDLGVDLFIVLSGFLMVFQYRQRSSIEDWASPATWTAFWLRRFFRIAPLFYILLAAALLSGPFVYEARATIDAFLQSNPQKATRYLDHSAANILYHLTFVFGLLPDYAFRTPLPDWSLGLEMQFYAAFPAFVLLARRLDWPVTAMIVGAVAVVVAVACQQLGVRFPMPSFLPLKMHIFLCGMLLAGCIGRSRRFVLISLGLALILAAVPIGPGKSAVHLAFRLLIIGGFFALVFARSGPVKAVAGLLSSRPFHWLGELSYGIYLIHLLIMQPVAAQLIEQFGATLSAPARFGLTLLITAPLAYGLSYLTYRCIELPGQKIGKTVVRRIIPLRASALSTEAEKIAAP